MTVDRRTSTRRRSLGRWHADHVPPTSSAPSTPREHARIADRRSATTRSCRSKQGASRQAGRRRLLRGLRPVQEPVRLARASQGRRLRQTATTCPPIWPTTSRSRRRECKIDSRGASTSSSWPERGLLPATMSRRPIKVVMVPEADRRHRSRRCCPATSTSSSRRPTPASTEELDRPEHRRRLGLRRLTTRRCTSSSPRRRGPFVGRRLPSGVLEVDRPQTSLRPDLRPVRAGPRC